MLTVLSAMAAGVAVVLVLICPLITISFQEPVRVNKARLRQQNDPRKMLVVECVL